MIISNFQNKKVVDYLREKISGGALIIFNHGLGDLINFIPIFEELSKRFHKWNLWISTNSERGLNNLIHPRCFVHSSDSRDMLRKYSLIFKLTYPEPLIGSDIVKPYFCNEQEIGLDNFIWTPYKMNIDTDNKTNLVGLHFTGRSSTIYKSIPKELSKKVLSEVYDAGYSPYLCINFDLKQMIDKMRKTKFFIGIDSGPFYTAGSIIGYENCIGMERNMLFNRYIPIFINKVDMNNYKEGTIKDKILTMKGACKNVNGN